MRKSVVAAVAALTVSAIAGPVVGVTAASAAPKSQVTVCGPGTDLICNYHPGQRRR